MSPVLDEIKIIVKDIFNHSFEKALYGGLSEVK